MNNWRLTGEIVVYCLKNPNPCVYIASPEKKQYLTAVTKEITSECFSEFYISDYDFEMKLGNENLTVFIKSDKLPTSDWYEVKNLYSPGIWSILTQSKIENGMILDSKFEAVFNDEYLGVVSFISNKMSEYKDTLEEMRRRVNCELHKKTKKWIPGHRYDTLTDTYYFLGTFKSRRGSNRLESNFITDPTKMPDVYLVVNSLNDSDKTISDIFNTRCYGTGKNDIVVLTKLPSAVESGEALVDDFSGDVRDYWEVMLNNAVEKGIDATKRFPHEYLSITDSLCIFDIFAYQNIDKLEYEGDSIERFKDIVDRLVFERILNNWNITRYRKDTYIGSSKTLEENIENCSRLFLLSIQDVNILKSTYYTNLFSQANIDLRSIVEDNLKRWDENTITSSFDNFLKYNFYYSDRINADDVVFKQRVTSTSYKLKTKTLESVYGNNELRNTLIEIINYAKNNFGMGVKYYNETNVGNKKDPNIFIKCIITLNDIVKFKKGVLNMPETLKNEIILNKFCYIVIEFDKDGIVE